MTEKQYDILLEGCAPVPLAHYLKALGILRLVSEQVDPQAQGWWESDSFWLRSTLDEKGLTDFFLKQYEPTPIVAPWNGGSGFFPKDSQDSILQIRNSSAKRLSKYRYLINLCFQLLDEQGLSEKPDKDEKPLLLQRCRNRFPDEELVCLDAAFLLTEDGPKYPPLLGTGWNDGRLEFTNNYMQRICEIFDCETGEVAVESISTLDESLFASLANGRIQSSIGQFDPGSAGGANSSSINPDSRINPWDFLLMLEGAIVFAAASVKQLSSNEPGTLAFPFCVRASGAGYGSASTSDEADSRNEMWMPLWPQASTFLEITTLLSEGRAELQRKSPKNSVEFARAISALGTDRGINAFQRYGFMLRNGLSYFAVPLDRYEVKSNPRLEELIAPIDSWLERFRSVAKDENNPESARRALRKIETAILEMCQRGNWQDVQNLLIALGEAEAAIAISPKLREKVKPIPPLSSRWIEQAYPEGGDIEFRLAASLASLDHEKIGPLRRHFEPLEQKTWYSGYCKWSENDSDPDVVWSEGSLVHNMTRVLHRRMVEVIKQGKQSADEALFAPLGGKYMASLGDIASFIAGDVDDKKIDRLLHGLILVRWKSVRSETLNRLTGKREPRPFAPYALLKLCFLPGYLDAGINIPLQPAILHRAASGDIASATRLAAHRLRGSGLPPAVEQIECPAWQARRTVAALLFPIRISQAQQLKNLVVRREEPDDTSEDPQETESGSIAHHV